MRLTLPKVYFECMQILNSRFLDKTFMSVSHDFARKTKTVSLLYFSTNRYIIDGEIETYIDIYGCYTYVVYVM